MKPFRHVERPRLNRSVFDLSHSKLFDCDLGQLIPVLNKRVLPGDHFKIGNEIIIRANPLVAPILHEINVYVHYFFVPLRLLWPKPSPDGVLPEPGSWEDFFTGGPDGTLEPTKPKWVPSSPAQRAVHTLWDYFGFPVDVDPVGAYPDPWYLRAYNFIFNEYYRDQNYMQEVDFDDWQLKRRCWEKDYFTSALPWPQRGIAPSMPIDFQFAPTSAIFNGVFGDTNGIFPVGLSDTSPVKFGGVVRGTSTDRGSISYLSEYSVPQFSYVPTINDTGQRFKQFLENNNVPLQDKITATTFDINDLRLAFRTQEFLERAARGGGRYTERLQSHYGVSPRDDRLQRPEYIGGTRSPVIVSEVLQTSSTVAGSPQGNLAGHGMSVSKKFAASYYVKEFGVILGIMSMMPRPVYQQGMERELLGETRYDEFLPEFVHLGEQPVLGAEVFVSNNANENQSVFGFNGRFDEYRVARNVVCGQMRNNVQDSLGFWHIARYFANRPQLNSDFLRCEPRKDYLAVPSEPGWIVHFGNTIRAVRPLPVIGIPRGV